ncbi:MAG: dephospho-CoA kinase [Phycicoccus sp.]|uniref:dephospho-CoA kinase n=1 Tax=Phycicoccus TaxID=367298 RepID=UPI00258532DD|nr:MULTISPECIES: dephospho-CoA kinase [Phycicoccus]MCO5302225.1 dephospho-CoA kinase [Phycicoccus sp.]HPF75737.1 dephospho-CoA kinase [Phycicoccus elongatus]
MLRVGLTGGIGSGKSSVAARLAGLGAVVIDADRIAREVVEPGMPSLTAIRERFGPSVVSDDGILDRAGLGRIVFGDRAALRDLEAITHPAIWARTAELFAAAPDDAIVVHDMPLLVEAGMTGEYHLVLAVLTDTETRVQRLVEHRGIPEDDARQRIAAQADDDARRAAADVLLDNNGSPEDLATAVDALWQSRIVPFAEALRSGTRSRAATSAQSPPDPTWPAQAARLLARIGHALGDRVVALEHIGSTAVPDLPAKDVIDLQVGVRDLTEADGAAFVADLASAGFVRVPGVDHDNAKDGGTWPKRLHGSVDPGRVAHVHVRAVGSPGWDWAIDVRDWLRADPEARDAYAAAKVALAARHTDSGDYADAKEAWFDGADDRLRTWRAARQS